MGFSRWNQGKGDESIYEMCVLAGDQEKGILRDKVDLNSESTVDNYPTWLNKDWWRMMKDESDMEWRGPNMVSSFIT